MKSCEYILFREEVCDFNFLLVLYGGGGVLDDNIFHRYKSYLAYLFSEKSTPSCNKYVEI
jgi:hypothetical protein